MSSIEKRINKWIIKTLTGKHDHKPRKKNKGIIQLIQDFFKTGLKELKKNIK